MSCLDSHKDLFFFRSMSRSRAVAPNPTLIQRLRGTHDVGWQAREPAPRPEIQIEAADELQRMEYLLTKHKDFLVSKGLFAEFVNWAG
jgi:hypothetical protein